MFTSLLSTFFIAVGLAMDAFSVSVAGGAALKKNIFRTALIAGLLFGFFQFAMPLIGYVIGVPITDLITPYGYWIVFFLFLFVGGKMIYDAVFGSDECGIDLTGWKVLLLLAVATSLDALAVGVSYALLGEAILLPSIIIGVVAFAFSAAGVFVGKKLGCVLGNKMEIIGGVILILIGCKFLLENIL
ncbi:MAG: manganese efflux pump MntP family protein [Methanocalculaceae archaeon]|jgi:putative Mn2+ efflux pump MntP|nr:manganese efflux pump MntP family protein [Methanocalculaceae archaeon]